MSSPGEVYADSAIPGTVTPLGSLSSSVSNSTLLFPFSGTLPANLSISNNGQQQFHVVIDSEILLCYQIIGSTLYCYRAQEGTTATTHAAGASVWHFMTQMSLAGISNTDDVAPGVLLTQSTTNGDGYIAGTPSYGGGQISITTNGGYAYVGSPLLRTTIPYSILVTPSAFPSIGDYLPLGIDMVNTTGWNQTATIVTTAGTNNTTSTLALASPAPLVTGHTRLADVVLGNSGGTISYSAWQDRRIASTGLLWFTLPLFSGWSNYNNQYSTTIYANCGYAYDQVRALLYLKGLATPNTAYSFSGTNQSIAQLPAWLYPTQCQILSSLAHDTTDADYFTAILGFNNAANVNPGALTIAQSIGSTAGSTGANSWVDLSTIAPIVLNI